MSRMTLSGMTHLLLAFSNGKLSIAKPIVCKNEDDLVSSQESFLLTHVDSVDQCVVITEEELNTILNLDVFEEFDTGI